jgi:uncharacterized protein involved in exopolysaccharide biosynthesis
MDSAEIRPKELTLLDLAVVVLDNLRLLLLLPVLVAIGAYTVAFFLPPTYVATARILPPTQQPGGSAALLAQLGSLANLVGGAGALKNPADLYVSLLKSSTICDSIVTRFNLKELYEEKYLEDVRKELDRRTRITAGPKDGLISIEVEDRDPKRAADIANAFVEELRALSKTLAIGEAAQRRLFFEGQLAQTTRKLTEAEIALRGSGVSSATLRAVPNTALEALARLKAQITAQEIRLASMRTFMTESHAELKLAHRELTALQTELSKAESSNTTKGTGDGVEYIAKYRDFKYHETLFDLMAKQYELARLDEAREGAVIQDIDVAKPPERTAKPRKALIAGVFGGIAFVLCLLFAFSRHVLQMSSIDPRNSERISRLRMKFRWVRRTRS